MIKRMSKHDVMPRKSGVVTRRVRQTGVVLVMALIALVAITLAALSLVRSIDTGVMIAGNQAFKESCLGASDVAIESASKWLSAQAAGRVTVVHAQAGDQVESGALLVEIELENNPET